MASPLTPHASDLQIYAQALDAKARTLLLGVTQQIAALDLRGVAVDHNRAMINAHTPNRERWAALQADWLALPLATGSMAQVVGDGALSVMRHAQAYPRLLRELRRVLQPGGRCVLRLFVAPDKRESVDDIVAAVQSGRVGSFHVLKWRLMMSLSSTANSYNVRVADALALFNRRFSDRAELLRMTNWPAEVYDTIDVYHGSGVSLSFPPRAVVDALFGQFAARVHYCTGDYELAERCPVVILDGFHA